ncbi:virulence factor TspB C-terminal domain-related protein [Cupriavidus campinensis]
MRALVLVLLSFLAGVAQAAPVPMQVGAGVARSAASSTSYITTASSTSWAGAAYNSGMTASVGGRAVTVPASWRMAANAGQIAVAAVRSNPAGLAASVALTWLLGYGIQKCAQGGLWCTMPQPEQSPNGKPFPVGNGYYVPGYAQGVYPTPQAACEADVGYWNGQQPTRGWSYVSWRTANGDLSTFTQFYCAIKDNTGYVWDGPLGQHPRGCPAGYTVTTTECVPPGYVPGGESKPTTDADWSRVSPSTLPDAVLNNLARDGVFLDVSPSINTARQTVPMSDPYIDPVTGKRYQDVAYVTPNADGKTADVQVAKQEVDSEGKPATDASGVQAPPVEQKDPCVGHEDRLGCMKLDDPPQGPKLEDNQKTISITPDTGWGADSMACPADLTTVTRTGGVALAFSFKPVCDGADMFRPVIIGMAWVAAVLIALGVGRKGD